jgi:hypothetical protein
MKPYQGEYYTRMTPPAPTNTWGMHCRRVVLQHTDECVANGSRAQLWVVEPHEECIGWLIGIIEGPGLLAENKKLKELLNEYDQKLIVISGAIGQHPD